MSTRGSDSGLSGAFLSATTSSFAEFLSWQAPDLLPGAKAQGNGAAADVRHGTTIVAVTFPGGVVMAGDRRATVGTMIAQRDIEKVYPADDYSSIGIAGTAGIALELVKLFQVELEHYEKIEGSVLSLDGKANRLASMIRANLGLAFQGLGVIPLFAGFDHEQGIGRIFSYDITGGLYEEHSFYSVGSGSVFARGALKKLFRDDFTVDQAVLAAVHALYDAADDDSATGGPDTSRRIYPIITVVDAGGYRRLSDADAAVVGAQVIASRMEHPGGPPAVLG